MISRIQEIKPQYNRLQGILPEEIEKIDLVNSLCDAKNKVKDLIDEDEKKIKDLSRKKNKIISFDEFEKVSHIIKIAFWKKGDSEQDDALLYYAHWIMSSKILEILSENVLAISSELIKYYNMYRNETNDQTKRTNYVKFARTYMDFSGYIANIDFTITNYYDLFVVTCHEIDPDNKETPIIAFRSDIFPEQFLSAIKELLLLGNYGRWAGFPLLRPALEVFITRTLFDLNDSKFSNSKIVFKTKNIPSITTICNCIDKLELGNQLDTDSIRRIYDWSSIVSHRGYNADEYVTWFLYFCIRNILGKFNSNLKKYKDQILEKLKNDRIIDFNNKHVV